MELSEIKNIRSRQITALVKNGIDSVEALAMSVPVQLEEIHGISEKASKNLIWESREMLNMSSFVTANEIREDFGHISTGSKAFDEILEGGIFSGKITEVFGAFKSGKTCLSHTLAVTTQLPEDMGGLAGSVLFLDTENTFSKAKLKRIARRFGIDENAVLRNIYHARIYSTDHQMQMVREAEKLVKEKNVKLIIIDSLMALMRSEYVGIGMLASRQQVLNRLIHDLSRMAETYNVAIFLTNQVATQMKGTYSANDAIGGNIVAHGCHFRIRFRASGFSFKASLERKAVIVDAPDLPPEECTFFITEAGVSDEEKIEYHEEPIVQLSEDMPSKNLGPPSIEKLEEDFDKLRQSGFEDKYDQLIEEFENSEFKKDSGAVYSRGLTSDFKDFLNAQASESATEVANDPLEAAEKRLAKS